jgi:coniferyl-aldehyde dehydrogenase
MEGIMAQVQSLIGFEVNSEATRVLKLQRDAFQKNRYPSMKERTANLEKLKNMLLTHQDEIAEAISKDFGNRSVNETKLVELFSSIDGINYAIKHLKKWMKPRSRHTSIWFVGGKGKVLAQPKGVVGIIVPWNYPLFLNMGPLTSALAAGNRCMIKMAANSDNIRALLAKLIDQTFDEDMIKLLPGVKGSEFSCLPFNHMIFTGSAETGKQIMRSASENLVPVTLELGGKSPVVFAEDYDLTEAVERMLFMKLVNAGQTCVAPDYAFVHASQLDEFVKVVQKVARSRYPNIDTDQYTSVINEKAYRRLCETIEDAENLGAKVIPMFEGDLLNEGLRKINPRILTEVNPEMRVCNEEIFGPLLPVITYHNISEVLDYINERQNPLALYIFSNNKNLQNRMINETLSGGVTINDCAFHVIQDDLPFGGYGYSGMGQYHAQEGFNEFSKLRPIFKQAKFSLIKFLMPPYGKNFDRIYSWMVR